MSLSTVSLCPASGILKPSQFCIVVFAFAPSFFQLFCLRLERTDTIFKLSNSTCHFQEYNKEIFDILLDYQSETDILLKELNSSVALVPGLNRPTIKALTIMGDLDSFHRFDEMIFHLTGLTSLELKCHSISNIRTLELDRILETLPNLTYLLVGSPMLDSTKPMYKLRSFGFEPRLFSIVKPSSGQLFQKLGDLVSMAINGPDFSTPPSATKRISLQGLGESLRRCCPKLEKIMTTEKVPLYFYILPASVSESHLILRGKDVTEQQALEDLQREQFEEAIEVFSNLTHYIANSWSYMAAEDLRCLGVKACYLTHVELGADPPSSGYSNIYSNLDFHQQDIDGAQKRHAIASLDLQLFLETCKHLKHFDARGPTIHLEYMTPFGRELSRLYYQPSKRHGGRQPVIRSAKPWACEDTLETLSIGFGIISCCPSDHRIVFEQLGRCRRLRSLTIRWSTLIPTLTHGVDLLADLAGSLEEIVLTHQSKWVCDDRATLEWMVTHLSKLHKLEMPLRRGSFLAEKVKARLSSAGAAGILHVT